MGIKPTKPLTNWFPLPEKGDLFVSGWVQWEVVEINDPSVWFCKIFWKNKHASIGFHKLWENIDQKKGWFAVDEVKKTSNTTVKAKKTTTKKTTKTTKATTKTKYDWVAIKQEFFESDFADVKPFLELKYSLNTVTSWNAQQKTKWWADEKKKIQDDLKIEALKNFKSNMKQKWDEVFDKLEQAHVKWLDDLACMILEQWEVWEKKKAFNIRDKETWEMVDQKIVIDQIIKPYLWHFDIINILKHVKLEKGEPTDIVNDGVKAKQWLDEMRKSKDKQK